MGEDIICTIAFDMLSIPPLVFRIVRKKLINTTLADSDVDIKAPHFEILRLLIREGTLHVAQIGEKLAIAKAQMTHLIDHLVQLQFVEREIDTTDRRTINGALTDKGRNFVKEQDILVINAVREKMSHLDDRELEEFSSSLRNVRDILMKLGT